MFSEWEMVAVVKVPEIVVRNPDWQCGHGYSSVVAMSGDEGGWLPLLVAPVFWA